MKVIVQISFTLLLLAALSSCSVQKKNEPAVKVALPSGYNGGGSDSNSAVKSFREFFKDSLLVDLIDTALRRNFDVLTALQRIEVARADVLRNKGLLLPVINAQIAAGQRKFGKYTMDGVGNFDTNFSPNIEEEQKMPVHLPDYYLGLQASWEADIWGKLRNRKRSAIARYLSRAEGRNFLVSNLISEVSRAYYALLSLDEQLSIIQESIIIQDRALQIIRIQKDAGVANELAVKQFESQVLSSRAMEIECEQKIIETENRINYLLGRTPQPVKRNIATFRDTVPAVFQAGIPSELLQNRADIRQASYLLQASRADVNAAKAAFYPGFNITADVGFQAFNAAFLLSSPASLAYSVFGQLIAPIVNRSALKSEFRQATARQLESIYNYYQSVIKAYLEVYNEIKRLDNLSRIRRLNARQVDVLTEAVDISSSLFRTGRASYFEVLMTQQNMLGARLTLIETQQMQLNARVDLYKALGGGWR